MYRVELTSHADMLLELLEKQTRIRTVNAIKRLREKPRPHGCAKLKGTSGYYRIVVGDYRVVYSIQDTKLVIIVIEIAHRREVYRKL